MINQARRGVRNALEMLYEHKCTVIEYGKIKDPITKQTNFGEVEVLTDQPCRLSFQQLKKSEQTESANSIAQVIKLFISPDIEIKEGSKIVVTHNGRISEYKNSGTPAIYPTHAEYILELFKGWA